jgi:rod shape determining protein RodA
MILPVIGITLPFFSAGGSSTLCLYIGLGLVFSIYRFNRSRAAVNFRLSRISTPFSEF